MLVILASDFQQKKNNLGENSTDNWIQIFPFIWNQPQLYKGVELEIHMNVLDKIQNFKAALLLWLTTQDYYTSEHCW